MTNPYDEAFDKSINDPKLFGVKPPRTATGTKNGTRFLMIPTSLFIAGLWAEKSTPATMPSIFTLKTAEGSGRPDL